MSTIRHYQVLPWAMRPLDVLESIAEVPDRRVAKTGKSSIFWLLSSFFCQNCQPGNHDNGWSYYNDSIAKKKYHKSPGTALTTYRSQSTRTGRRFPELPCACNLAFIRHFSEEDSYVIGRMHLSTCRITLFIQYMYAPGQKHNRAHVFGYRETSTA